MFWIRYELKETKIHVTGGSPQFPNQKLDQFLHFSSSIEAETYYFAIKKIENEIEKRYEGAFALAIGSRILDITTATNLPPQEKGNIARGISNVINLYPIADKIEFYVYGE